MKTLPDGLQAHLDSGTTTLCWCWKLIRSDGLALGFTDHDCPLTFDAVTYEAESGFTAGQLEAQLNLSVDTMTASGALSSDRLNEADLAAGRFDNAEIEVWRVNWADPVQRVLMRKGVLGEVQRGKTAFQAELRGLAHVLNQPLGRVFAHSCDAVLGDAHCAVSITPASAIVSSATDARRFAASGLSAFADGWFTSGLLTFTSGANAGRAMEVKRHRLSSTIASVELWQALSEEIAIGDSFTVTPGCDKTFATCKRKFANAANFRGFPYMPGDNAALAGVSDTTPLDGGSRYGN